MIKMSSHARSRQPFVKGYFGNFSSKSSPDPGPQFPSHSLIFMICLLASHNCLAAAIPLSVHLRYCSVGMTRGMTAKRNPNASNRKKYKRTKTTDDNHDPLSWSNPILDILFPIIMRLGVIDFMAFSSVCKSWRTAAQLNRNIFMLSRQPITIHISTEAATRKECWLEDYVGRRCKTILPRSSGRTCLGLASGYLILFGRKTHDFKLVNPITRHELRFPRFPFHLVPDPKAFRGVLVFSPTMSSCVFVISHIFSSTVSFSLPSKQASWTHLSSDLRISDLILFKGKIYTLDTYVRLCEVRLNPEPALTLLQMENSMTSGIMLPEFATLGEKLCVTGYMAKDQYPVEADFDNMKWVINKLEFMEKDKPRMQYLRYPYVKRTDKKQQKRVISMPYYPRKCLDVDILHE